MVHGVEGRDDPSGAVLQRSKTLHSDLAISLQAGVQTVRLPDAGEIRVAVIPFQAGPHPWLFVSGVSNRDVESDLAALRNFALLLLPASLLLTAGVFGLVYGRGSTAMT